MSKKLAHHQKTSGPLQPTDQKQQPEKKQKTKATDSHFEKRIFSKKPFSWHQTGQTQAIRILTRKIHRGKSYSNQCFLSTRGQSHQGIGGDNTFVHNNRTITLIQGFAHSRKCRIIIHITHWHLNWFIQNIQCDLAIGTNRKSKLSRQITVKSTSSFIWQQVERIKIYEFTRRTHLTREGVLRRSKLRKCRFAKPQPNQAKRQASNNLTTKNFRAHA